MKIIVLMSTYNGEKYLRVQLDSLISQTLRPYKIFIRDDGSKDNTLNILKEYKNKYDFIDYYLGENKKPAKSFFELINKCEKADYYALCDQDDYWLPNKIEEGIKKLSKENNNIPLLYFSKFTLTDENLNPLDSNISKLYSYTDFAHSLLYTTAPGCTFIFNDEARNKIIKYDIEKNYCIIHDSIIHKVVALFGKVILDENSYIYYRQHSNNEIGMTSNKIKAFINRIKRFTNGKSSNIRSNFAKSLIDVYGKESDKDKLELMNVVANYQSDKELKKRLLSDKCFKVEGINYLFFKILVVLNYI